MTEKIITELTAIPVLLIDKISNYLKEHPECENIGLRYLQSDGRVGWFIVALDNDSESDAVLRNLGEDTEDILAALQMAVDKVDEIYEDENK